MVEALLHLLVAARPARGSAGRARTRATQQGTCAEAQAARLPHRPVTPGLSSRLVTQATAKNDTARLKHMPAELLHPSKVSHLSLPAALLDPCKFPACHTTHTEFMSRIAGAPTCLPSRASSRPWPCTVTAPAANVPVMRRLHAGGVILSVVSQAMTPCTRQRRQVRLRPAGAARLRANAAAAAVDEHQLAGLRAAHLKDVQVRSQRGLHEAGRLVVAQAVGRMQRAARVDAHLPRRPGAPASPSRMSLLLPSRSFPGLRRGWLHARVWSAYAHQPGHVSKARRTQAPASLLRVVEGVKDGSIVHARQRKRTSSAYPPPLSSAITRSPFLKLPSGTSAPICTRVAGSQYQWCK